MEEKAKILGICLDILFEMATDTMFYRFWLDFCSILGGYSVTNNRYPKTLQKKHVPQTSLELGSGRPQNARTPNGAGFASSAL